MLDIKFSVSGGTISQTVKMLTDEHPEVFIGKLNNGEYLTTIGKDSNIIDITSKGNAFKIVGKIINQDNDDVEYFDFERDV